MGYLKLDALGGKTLNMNEVVISLWFRIPKETAKKVKDMTKGYFQDFRVFHNVVPLITWGANNSTTVPTVDRFPSPDGVYDGLTGFPIMLEKVGSGYTAYMAPSYLGVRVETDEPTLDVNIQTTDNPTGTNLQKIAVSYTADHYADILLTPPLGHGEIVSGAFGIVYHYEDISPSICQVPDYLGNSDRDASGSGAGYPKVKLDEWNHVLISWELLPHSNKAPGAASKMWCAINDENKKGGDLPAMCDPFDIRGPMGENDHMAWIPFKYLNSEDAAASISFTPIQTVPVYIPALPDVKYSDEDGTSGETLSRNPIEKIELAELQIFTGITLDTSVEANRRAFIDYKRDAAGNPIEDADRKKTLQPVNPNKAEELFDRKPDILLHGSASWKQGRNTGSLAPPPPPPPVNTGLFAPTGTITAYKPDPTVTVPPPAPP